MKYSGVAADEFNVMMKTIMSQMDIDDRAEAIRLINSGEWIVSVTKKRWTIDEEGIIYIDLPVTMGITGPEWLEKFSVYPSEETKHILESREFVVTTGKTYKIAIIPGIFFSNEERTLSNVGREIKTRGWFHGNKISPEVACLLLEYLSLKDMSDLGLAFLEVLHYPMYNSYIPSLLLIETRIDGEPFLDNNPYRSEVILASHCNFVCVVSQDSQGS